MLRKKNYCGCGCIYIVVMHVRCGLIYFDYKKSGLYQINIGTLTTCNIVQQEYSASLYGIICSRRVTAVNGIFTW